MNNLYSPNISGRMVTVLQGYQIDTENKLFLKATTGTLKEVTLTGWYIVADNTTYYQTTDTLYRYVKMPSNASDDIKTKKTYASNSNAQNLVNDIIKNNKRILENNLICARFATKLSGIQRRLLYELQSRLEDRNKALLNKQLITSATESYPQGYANEASYLEQFMKNDGKVGVVVSSTVIIVVSAVVAVSLGAAAYFAYMAYYNESMEDVKFSDELTATLANKLTAEELQQLKEETAGIVTKARITSSLGTFGNLFKYAAFGVAGYFLYRLIAPKVKEYKSKNQK